MKAKSTICERLGTRRALIGLLQTHPSAEFTELAGLCGYDFLILDDQHGIFDQSDHLRMLHASSFVDMAVFVRLKGHDTRAIGRYLDMGANGIVVPEVETADEARLLARALEYPPAGTRGFAAPAHRATHYGLELAAHLKAPRDGISLLLIIESARGVANVEEILAVEGVDGVIIGPSDLSANLGCAGDYSQPQYMQAVSRIELAAATRGKLLGTAPHAGSPPEALIARGHRLLILASDTSLVREAMNSQVAQVKLFTH